MTTMNFEIFCNAIALEVECPICHVQKMLFVAPEDYVRWQNGELIQDCFPYRSPDEREMLISGICPDCWEGMFSAEED